MEERGLRAFPAHKTGQQPALKLEQEAMTVTRDMSQNPHLHVEREA